MVSWARVRILAQSDTASSTSRSTSISPDSRSAASSSAFGPSGRMGGSTSTCIQDSGVLAGSRLRLLGGEDGFQDAVEIATDQELGMEDLADAPPLTEHLHGDRIDQERSIVGDDLDDAWPRRPTNRRRRPPASRMSMVARAAGRRSASR